MGKNSKKKKSKNAKSTPVIATVEQSTLKVNHTCIDIIQQLHRKKDCINIVEQILSYLDGVTLKNAQLVCKAWLSAISSSPNACSKIWQTILDSHMNCFPLWKKIKNRLQSEIPKDNASYYQELGRNVKCVAKKLERNWTTATFSTTERLLDMKGLDKNHFEMNEKHVVMWDWSHGEIKVWKRENLEMKEEMKVHIDEMTNVKTNFELNDNLLVWGGTDGVVNIKDMKSQLMVKKSLDSEFKGENISYLRVVNGFFWMILSGKDVTNQKLVYWRLPQKKGIDVDFHALNAGLVQLAKPFNKEHDYVFIDKSIVLLTKESGGVNCRFLSHKKKMYKEITAFHLQDVIDVVYQDGHIVTVSTQGVIKIIDFKTQILRTTIETGIDFTARGSVMRVNYLYIIVCSAARNENTEKNEGTEKKHPQISGKSRFEIWDFQAAISPNEDHNTKKLQSICNFQAFTVTVDDFKFDELGIVAVHCSPTDGSSLHLLDFIPSCSYCKDVNKRLKRCGRCLSMWYCGPNCQQTDWKRHRALCVKRAQPSAI